MFVKRVYSLLFLLLYLISSVEGYQLLKFPKLVEHLREHRIKEKDLSLVNFLVMHYIGNKQPDADHKDDMQLPFKTHAECMNGGLVIILPPEHISILHMNNFGFEGEPMFYLKKVNDFKLSSSIWQPPQFC